MAQMVGDRGQVVAVDLQEQMLDVLRREQVGFFVGPHDVWQAQRHGKGNHTSENRVCCGSAKHVFTSSKTVWLRR